MQLEITVLHFLASEEFCSEFEIEQFVRLSGGPPDEAKQMIATWLERGWIEYLGGDDDPARVVRLTDSAHTAHPGLPRAT